MNLFFWLLETPEHKKLPFPFPLAFVDRLLRINQRINLTHYYLCACSQRCCYCGFHFEIEIVLQMSRPSRPRAKSGRGGGNKINGAKMIQLREPKKKINK